MAVSKRELAYMKWFWMTVLFLGLPFTGRTVAPVANATLPRVAAAAGATAALLQLSASLYSRDLPYPAIHAALAPCAVGLWAALDGSLQVLVWPKRQQASP